MAPIVASLPVDVEGTWQAFLLFFVNIWQNAASLVEGTWQSFASFFAGAWQSFAQFFAGAWQSFAPFFAEKYEIFYAYLHWVMASPFDLWIKRVASILVVGGVAVVGHIAASIAMFAALLMIGFGPFGPIAGSIAAIIQAAFAGGAVTAGSLFALFQSIAMGGTLVVATALSVVGAIIGALIGINIVAYFKCFFGWAESAQCAN